MKATFQDISYKTYSLLYMHSYLNERFSFADVLGHQSKVHRIAQYEVDATKILLQTG